MSDLSSSARKFRIVGMHPNGTLIPISGGWTAEQAEILRAGLEHRRYYYGVIVEEDPPPDSSNLSSDS